MARGTFEEYRERREKYLGKILEYEALFRRDPDAYFRKANLVRLSVYGTYLLIVLAVGALFFALVYRSYSGGRGNYLWMAVIGYILVQLIRAPLAVHRDESGLKIAREDAPGLFDLVDKVSAKMGGVAVDGIRVLDVLNASAETRVRNRLTGKKERHVVIGLPLLELFSADEVKGIIAHELGHFRGAHGEKAQQLYHAQETLEIAAASLSNSWIGGVLRSTAELFEERFDVLLLAVKREQEYEADAAELLVVGPEVYKDTSLKLSIFGRWYFQIRYGRTVEIVRQGWPGFAGLLEKAKEVDRSGAAKDLWRELERQTRPVDTHPAIADRLRHVGIGALPTSEEEARQWVDTTLDKVFRPAIEEWFTESGKNRVREHFEKDVHKDFERVTERVEEATKDDDTLAISPDTSLDLTIEASGANAVTFIKRLAATDRVYGRAAYVMRVVELVESPNPFHRFLAIQELWPLDKDLYEKGIVSLATVSPYEDYAAYLLFNLLEHQERLDEGKSVYDFLELRRERSRDFRGVFARGPRAMELRPASVSKDLEEYMQVFLSELKWVSAAYVVDAKPKGTSLPFETIFLVDYLSKKEAPWKGGDDYSGWTSWILQQSQCPTFVLDLCLQGDKWRKAMKDPKVRTLVPYRDPVREKKEKKPFWKRGKA